MTVAKKRLIVVCWVLLVAGFATFFAGAREVGFALLVVSAAIFVACGFTTF